MKQVSTDITVRNSVLLSLQDITEFRKYIDKISFFCFFKKIRMAKLRLTPTDTQLRNA